MSGLNFTFRQSKCKMLLNNLCECCNNFIPKDRQIHTHHVDWNLEQTNAEDKLKNYNKPIYPKIQKKKKKKLKKASKAAHECILQQNGIHQYQVECFYGKFIVDMENQTCMCKRWQGISHLHVITCILDKDNEGKELWLETEVHVLSPPWYVANKGRKQTKKRKGPEEVEVS